MNEAQKNLTIGDVVYGRPYLDGRPLPQRKGIVLGAWTDTNTTRVVIWWYRMGPANTDTTHVMYRSELTPAGDIFDMSGRTAQAMGNLAGHYWRVTRVRDMLWRHAARMAITSQ